MAFDVTAVLKANATQFSRGIKEAESMFDSLLNKSNSTMDKLSSGISVAGKAMTGIGLGVTAMGVSAAKGFGEFQMNLNKAAVVAGGTSKNIDELADVANRMGAELPISANEAAQAMIEMAQNGADLNKIKTQFPAIAQAATAAGADLTTTAGVVQQAMNVWGDSIGSSEQAAAILTQNANISNASIETMKQGLSNVASSSKLLGVNMTDASAAIGLITNTGMSAAQASQDLNHAMLKMAAPSQKSAGEMQRLGLSFTDAAGNMKPFKQILEEVAEKTKNMSQAEKTASLKNLFDTSGMQAINPLLDAVMNKTDDATKSWEAATNSLNGVSGSQADAAKFLADAANEMQQNMGSKIEQVGGNWEALTNTAMAAKGGVSSSLLDMTNNALSWAAGSDSAVAQWTRSFIGLSPVIGPIMTTVGTAMMNVNNIAKGLGGAFNGLKAVMSNPFALAVIAIAALVAGLVYAYQHSEKFRNIVNGAVSAVVAKFNELKAKAQPALDYIKNALGKFNIGAFAPLIGGIGLFIASIMRLKGTKIPNPFSKFKPTPIKFPNPFSGLADMAKAAGSAVKNAFVGIGKSVASVFKSMGTGIGNALRGLATVNPATMLAFAAAILAVGAAITMVLTQSAGLTALFNGIGTVISSVGSVITGFVTGVIAALANALITIAPALSPLSPLILAFGQALAMAAPFVTALGNVITNLVSVVVAALPGIITAFSGLVTAIASGVTQIVTALTPIVQIISTTFVQVVTVISQAIVQIIQALAPFIPSITTMFTTIATVVANAIVQIVQALAPFIPAVTQMVVALAPVLSQIVEAFNNLISQISPIIDSIGSLFESLGTAIESVLSGASDVISSFGNSIRTILDGVAGIFDSIGNSAKNAGAGVKLMAQGIAILTALPLGDMAATLAAVAAGLAAIVASGIGSAGAGLQAAGVGMQLMAVSAQVASAAIQMLPASLSLLTASLGTLPAVLTMAGVSMTAFAASAQSSVGSLMAIGATITRFAAMMIMIAPASAAASASLAAFNGQASAAGSAMSNLGSASASALGQVTALGAGITSSMAGATASIATAVSQMATAIPVGGAQMVVAMQASMNQIKMVVLNGMMESTSAVINGSMQMITAIISAGTQMVTITQSTMSQMKSAVQNGMSSIVSSVRNGGSQMVSAWQSAGQQMVASTQNFVNSANSSLRNIGSGVNLYSNGSSLMSGLKSGIDAGWKQITSSVSGMAQWIKDHKGPVSYDRRLLVDNGQAIMAGLFSGISTGWDKVKGLIAPMAGKISDFVQGGMADSFALPDVATVLGGNLTISNTPQSVQHNIDNVSSQQRLIKKFDELIDEVRRSGNTYLDGKVISRKVDQNLGQNTQLRSRTSWA